MHPNLNLRTRHVKIWKKDEKNTFYHPKADQPKHILHTLVNISSKNWED